MPRKRNFLKIFISFLKNRRKWGGVLFSPLRGQLSCRSCLETAARQEKPEGEAEEIRVHVFADFCAAKTRQGEGLMEERYNRKQVAPLIRRRSATLSPPRGKL